MKKFILTCLLIATTIGLSAQKFHETFTRNDMRGWYIQNNTYPPAAYNNHWATSGLAEGYIGPESDSDIPGELAQFFAYNLLMRFLPFSEYLMGYFQWDYNYASVGYTEADRDGAQISKWLVSPVIKDVKHGDVLKFRTKALSVSMKNRIADLADFNLQGVTSCNRPNRLEIRLAIADDDGPTLGRAVDATGDFGILLKVINDGLTVDGYPTNWTNIEVPIVGLPKGQLHNVHIAFWYRYDNGGYANCRVRKKLPPLEEALAMAALEKAKDIAIDGLESQMKKAPIGKIYQAATLGLDAYEVATQNQVGWNGSFIGIDDVQVVSGSNIYIIEDGYLFGGPNYVHYPGDGMGRTAKFGFQGSMECPSDLPYPKSKLLEVINESNESIELHPELQRIHVSDDSYPDKDLIMTVGDRDNDNILLPGEAMSVRLTPNDSAMSLGTYRGVVAFRKYPINGSPVWDRVYIEYTRDKPKPVKLKYKNWPQSFQLNENGFLDVDLKEVFDAGSENYCGGPEGLSFSLSRPNRREGHSSGRFICADVGEYMWNFRVYDQETNSYDQGEVKIKISIPTPEIAEGHEQTYYLKPHERAVPLEELTKPGITGTCNPEVVLSSYKTPYGKVFDFTNGVGGVGTYELEWTSAGLADIPAHGKSTLHVIDTIKPELDPDWVFRGNPILIPFTFKVPGAEGSFIKTHIEGSDHLLAKGKDNVKISHYEYSTPFYQNGAWVRKIPFDCADAGQEHPVTVRIYDISGNYTDFERTIKFASPDEPVARDIRVDLDPKKGVAYVTPEDLLENGADGICSISNAYVTKYAFSCEDVNQTIADTVYYTLDGAERFAVGTVTVNEYSQPAVCEDTVYLSVPADALDFKYQVDPVLSSVCSDQLTWSFKSAGSSAYNDNAVSGGSILRDFAPGISQINRTTEYLGQTYTCEQVLVVVDTIPPVLISTPSDVQLALPSLNGACTRDFEITNPFKNGTHTTWTYELTGATERTVTLQGRPAFDANVWNETEFFNPGITNVRIWSVDKSGNTNEVSYKVDLYVQSSPAPSVVAEELNVSVIEGNFDGEVLEFPIESPVSVVCDQVDYMWYYEVRDAYQGTILYEQDSISQNSGANIPLKVGPATNQTYFRTVHLGYHEKDYGTKTYTYHHTVQVRDSVTKIACPKSVVVENTDDINYTYQYTLAPKKALAAGGYWGYVVKGATFLSSEASQSVTYNSNQTIALGEVALEGYPSLAYDDSVTLNLNNGVNYITLTYVETSGNMSECVFVVEVQDATTPVMTCPPADTLHRSDVASCLVDVAGACTTVTGFTGPFGVSKLNVKGINDKIRLRKELAPDSITFVSISRGISFNDMYVEIPINCDGTVSFDWQYQSQSGEYFRPFIIKNDYDRFKYSQNTPAGFDVASKAIQTGSFSQTVVEGDRIFIGLTEGGVAEGYFTIKNFSAPNADLSAVIEQPVFTENPSLYFSTNAFTSYPVGTHEVMYTLKNLNNGNEVSCTQQLVVIDDFETELACMDTTLALNAYGKAQLIADDIINSCFSVSNITLSQTEFDCSDLGVNQVTISSVNSAGDTISCTANITIIDQIAPRLLNQVVYIDLPASNTVTLSDSVLTSYFVDNCKVQSVTASQTTFDCEDVGTRELSLTASDTSGNEISVKVLAKIKSSALKFNDLNETFEVCAGEPLQLTSPFSDPDNPVDFIWQMKDVNDSIGIWDYYSCTSGVEMIKGSYGHRLFLVKTGDLEGLYTVYKKSGTSDLFFAKLNTITDKWEPALKRLSVTPNAWSPRDQLYQLDAYPDGDLYIVFSTGDQLKAYKWAKHTNDWHVPTAEYDPFQSHGDNYFNSISLNDGFLFGARYDGGIYAARQGLNVNFLFEAEERIHKATNGNDLTIKSSKNLLIIRHESQNQLRWVNHDSEGYITSVDTLNTDPTSNSSTFMLASWNGDIYVAFKAASGNMKVSKYLGNDSWSDVSSGLGTEAINVLDIKSVGSKLYAVASSNTEMKVYSFNGSVWEDEGTLANTFAVSLYSLSGELVIKNGNDRLFRKTNWKNIQGAANAATYTPDTSVPSEKIYRSVGIEQGCDFIASGTKTVTVHEVPKVSTVDQAKNGAGTLTLQAETTAGQVYWLNSLDSTFLGLGAQFELEYAARDDYYFTYAENEGCFSDTLISHVFVNDEDFYNYTVSYPDTVCYMDQALISIDSALYGVKHRLFEKGEDGHFAPSSRYSNFYAGTDFYMYPTETKTYKIKVVDEVLDAANFAIGGHDTREHLSYDTVQLNYTDEFTVEAWVRGSYSFNPSSTLGMQYNNATGGYEPANERNFEWNNGYFLVANGDTARQLTFPAFPTTHSPWVHVAATASPQGLKIYYNGVLAASLDSAVTGNINNERSSLRVGLTRTLSEVSGFAGLDEFRIWDHERSATEIDSLHDQCLTGDEQGLLVYTNFEEMDLQTREFTSQRGPNAIIKNQAANIKPQLLRTGYCVERDSTINFLEPFTIHVREDMPYIVSMDEEWPTSSGGGEEEGGFFPGEGGFGEPGGGGSPQVSCIGDTVTLNAEVSYGTVYWYASEMDGDTIGSGSPFTIFLPNDTVLYAGVGGSCDRYPVEIDVNGAPKILSASADTTCAGGDASYSDINFNIDLNPEADDYYLYETPTGGEPINRYGGLSDFAFTGTDTLYASAYSSNCESEERVQIIIPAIVPKVVSITPDTTVCGPQNVRLTGKFIGNDILWMNSTTYSTISRDTVAYTGELEVGTHQFEVRAAIEGEGEGCSSAREYVTVTVEAAPSRYDTVVTCGSYTWIDGMTYTESDPAILFNKESGVYCDSAIYLNLTIIDVADSDISVSTTNTCPGEEITFSLATTESGVDYRLVNNEDSVFAGPTSGTGSELTMTTGGLAHTEVFRIIGNKSQTVGSASNTCDVQVGDAITVNIGQTTSSRTVARCGDYLWNGNTYFETGTYYDTLTSSLGCDSVARLNLTIFPEPEHTHVVEACDSYTWKGTTYTASTNTPTWTGKTLYGCDSLVTLDLTIHHSVTYDTAITACDAYEWNASSYTSSGSYMQTLSSAAGCDSTVTVQLTILESSVSDTTAVACKSFDWYGNTYSASGEYNRIITNSAGCDSTITLHLTINEATFGDTTAVACSSFDWYGTEYTASGDYEHLLTNSAGCDSTVTLHLTINEPTSSDTTAVSCGPFTWYGSTYETSGDYQRVIENTAGCDSTINLHLTVNPESDPEYSSFDVETCHSYTFDGTEFTTSGSYQVTYQNTMGCDSIVTLNLTLLEGKCYKNGEWVNGAPGTTDDVVIAGSYEVTTELRVKDLKIADGGVITVPENGVLEIAGNISNNGSITLQSGSDFLSYEGQTYTGNDITFQRNMRHETAAYSMMGSPVQQSADIKGSIAGITWGYKEVNPYEAGNTEGLKRWINYADKELVPGHGYASANTQQLVFEGNPNVGTITVENLTYTPEAADSTNAGWHLLANPYGTSIDVDAFLTANQTVIEGHISLWDDPNTGERGSNSDYMTMNAVGEISNNPRGNRFNGHVLTGQGFFAKRLANATTPANVVFTEAMRNTGYNQDASYFRQDKKQMAKVWVGMTDGAGRYSETLIGFPEDATLGRDHFYDAPKIMTATGHQFYSVLEKVPYAIQGVPLADEVIIPVGYKRDGSGYVTLELKAESQVPDGYEVILVDKAKNTEYPIQSQSVYVYLDDNANDRRFSLALRKLDVLHTATLLNKVVVSREASDIRVSSRKYITSITLIDLMGKSTEMNHIDHTEYSFAAPKVEGVYLVHIQLVDGSTHTRKLIID
ncbi:LamG domain-containing protein [Marinoscillum furvescens]|uniref:Concanavalin A-like lectin/glucanase superfamily protein n=1 Tax=Marinoscillum furvescens DSM 4134 TaxID=1122208 RepID=A0A3D9L7L0_MARFU|nr:LamG-like jellyroll fold domain-containing protein [Marinoscillum furvescens]REE00467.1 concanavalin A-like lectin/glucanase superfamily protein [Marinoscillum furvescens DSM 4134]